MTDKIVAKLVSKENLLPKISYDVYISDRLIKTINGGYYNSEEYFDGLVDALYLVYGEENVIVVKTRA